MWKSLYDFPQSFVSSNFSVNVSLTYDDEDLSVWDVVTKDTALHGAVKGKLGGPSQRRLSVSATTVVLQAVRAFYTSIMVYGLTFHEELDTRKLFIGGAEISLATYEALVSIMRVLASTYFAHSCCLVEESEQLFPETEGRPHLDYMGVYFIQNINDLLGFRVLARTQRVVLLDIATIFLFVMRYISLLPYYLIFGL
ncbi:hypothetical protein VNO78_08306 [Psophocarpus tetragonolobus]|uniref:Uncharacterized protein n=1 Tax=Psophocarpus tetragonolobus TaxID=3891 RepID=A0AAN9T5D0_PSOTE